MKPSAWRAALRIARRDAARAKGRSALVLAMIALPVLGVAGVDVIARSAQLEPAEQAARTMGTAQAAVTIATPGEAILQSPDGQDTTGRGPAEPKDRPKTPAEQRSASTDPAQLLTELLPGAVLVPTGQVKSTSASTVEGRMSTSIEEVDLTDPVWHGKLNVVEGSAPTRPDQLAATRAFLDRSGLRIGDRTALRGLDARPYTITAVAEDPGRLDDNQLYGRPGAVLSALAQAEPEAARSGPQNWTTWLVKLPAGAALDWPKVKELNEYGFTAASRAVLLHPPARAEVPYYAEAAKYSSGYVNKSLLAVAALVPGMALLEIVLLAGPAFAVGARRSRRQLGLLAAGGGDRSHVRAVVLAGGAVLGTGGAVLGLFGGVGLVALLRGPLEEYGGQRFGHFDVQPLDLLGVALVGLVTGLLAAVVPAVQASRQDVVEALTGRGGSKPASRLVAALGVVMVAGGTALALLCAVTNTAPVPGLLGGSVIAELGMLLCTPLLIGLFGRLGRHLPLSPRLALRDSVRNRGRTAPAVAAVMAAVAGAVAVGIYHASDVEKQRQDYRPSLPAGAVALMQGGRSDAVQYAALREAVEKDFGALGERADVLSPTAVPRDCGVSYDCGYVQALKTPEKRCPAEDATTHEERERLSGDPRCTEMRSVSNELGNMFGDVLIGDPALLHNLLDVHDPAAEQALAAGKALVFRPDRVADGKAFLRAEEQPTQAQVDAGDYRGTSREVVVDAVEVHSPLPFASIVMSREAAQKAGLGVRSEGSLWKPAVRASDGTVQKAEAHLAKLDDTVYLDVEQGFKAERSVKMLGLTAFAALVALGAAGIATGLAAADSQQDLATLAAVGASGGIRRRLSGFQCGVIAAMGSVLGLLCGAVPAVALRLLEARNAEIWINGAPIGHEAPVIAVPWADLAALLVGLPVVAVLLAALLTRSRVGLTRRAG
ncbi:ABC transporter permease [Kitasatospora sp. NA04385]|uniref:FtsX-like permease family protein n=1 Tax=Kitasatospora sp. NA04385 TaxID=2742135 RepID=UPI0015921CBB|nr:FtsX-like permease family protein [Kitasatospora sp. NA04385]QKW21458.1 ABC transporter permease [Kitasatospora sp. NA04385]